MRTEYEHEFKKIIPLALAPTKLLPRLFIKDQQEISGGTSNMRDESRRITFKVVVHEWISNSNLVLNDNENHISQTLESSVAYKYVYKFYIYIYIKHSIL